MDNKYDELRNLVITAIDDEPEYPGDVPEKLNILLQEVIASQSMDALVEALRISVRLTKQGISERVTRMFDEKAGTWTR